METDWKAKGRRESRVEMAAVAAFWIPWLIMGLIALFHGPMRGALAPLIASALLAPFVVWLGGRWLIR